MASDLLTSFSDAPSDGDQPRTAANGAAQASVPHQAIYRRWRAQRFGDVLAQDAIVETLRNAVRLDRLAHGLLFVGPRGTGKTSTARIVAKAVNCSNALDGEPDDSCDRCVAIRDGRALDVVELDAASNNRVDDMRELLPRVYTAPADLKKKVFIIDEVQRIKEGWDVLLKTLEEPPPDVLFIFCTTDPSGIRPAVISRLQRFTFRPLPERQITAKLRRIAEAEGRSITDEALALISQRASGGMRDAESMLDQVISSGIATIDADTVRDLLGLAEMESVDSFIAALAGADPLTGIRLLDDLERDGRDLVAFADQVVARLREQLIGSLASGQKNAGATAALTRAARRLATLDANKGAAGGYRLQLELALLEGATERPTDQPAPARSQAPAPLRTAEPAPTPAPPTRPPEPTRTAEPTQTSEPVGTVQPTPAQVAAALPPPALIGIDIDSDPPAEPKLAGESTQSAPSAKSALPDPSAPQGPDAPLQSLLDAWSQVVDRIGQNPANKPLIAACRPVEVHDATIVLGFPESKAFLRDAAERKRSVFEAEIGHVLGRAVAVRCVTTNIEIAPTDATAADDLVAQAKRIFEGELLDVAEVD
jgi:DNA polymerase-3 subunit gamma/tau